MFMANKCLLNLESWIFFCYNNDVELYSVRTTTHCHVRSDTSAFFCPSRVYLYLVT